VLYACLASLAGGLLCGGLVLIGVGGAKSNRYAYYSSAPAASRTVTVQVALGDIPAGTFISQPETMFRVRLYRAGTEPKGSITSHEQVRYRVLGRALQNGEPCSATDVALQFDRLFPLEGNTHALVITTPAYEMPGSHLAGYRVDILAVSCEPDRPLAVKFALIAEQVMVLAGHTGYSREGEIHMPQWQLVLAVTRDQGEAIAAAAKKGPVQIGLRRPGDPIALEALPATLDALMGRAPAEPVLVKDSGKPEPP
jgi:Flp pilus assembly protein CpaB